MTLSYDFTHDTLVEVRREVERQAERHGMSGVALYRFVVAVNELTTNAVRHGGGRGRLDLWRSDARLHCRVTDRGPGLPAGYEIRRPPARAADGRRAVAGQSGRGEPVVPALRRSERVHADRLPPRALTPPPALQEGAPC